MPADSTPRQKKSKLEKIAELECSLKIAREENKSLKKALHATKRGDGGGFGGSISNFNRSSSNFNESSSSSLASVFNMDKMKEALKALKRVTVNQEMSLQQLREKANVRRKQLEEKDEMIAALQRNIQSLLKNQIALEGDGDDDNSKLKVRVNELQRHSILQEAKYTELQEQLSQAQLSRNSRQPSMRRVGEGGSDLGSLNESISGLRGSLQTEGSMRSLRSLGLESVTTTQELDVAKLKQELAKKSNRIVQLEYELDMVKDDLSELRRKQKNDDLFKETGLNGGSSTIATAEAAGKGRKEQDAFASDPFGAFDGDVVASHGDDFYSDKEEDDNDDWW
jgi:hypothetical protein